MTRVPNLRKSYSHAAMAMVVLALMARMLVPQGWMPSRAPGQVISICTGVDGMTKAILGKDGTLKELPEGGEHETSENPCAFAGIAMGGALPDMAAARARLNAVSRELPAQTYSVSIGRGLAAPPPPATGPPVLI